MFKLYLFSLLFFAVVLTPVSHAQNIDWSGLYRIEGYHIKNSEFNEEGRQKDFGLQHLILRPKIVAADGLIIRGQFNIFNSANYPNSQVGQIFGSPVNASDETANSFPDSNSQAQNNKAEDIEVSQLYLTFNHEFGQVIAGRAPIHFGLGMFHNSGQGIFDHFYDTRDLVGYKVVVGNFWILPMIGKVSEGGSDDSLNRSDDVTDYMAQLQYDNPETRTEMGAFYQNRKSGTRGSDGPTDSNPTTNYFGTGTSRSAIDNTTIGIYYKKSRDTWSAGFEAGFQNGNLGVTNSAGNQVTMSGFGMAIEGSYLPENSPSEFHLKLGYASGDDKSTQGEFEGFIFDRNYNVGFLMMNHTLGQADFLNTRMNGGGPNPTTNENDQVDVESISNVIYLAPSFRYSWSEKWFSTFTVITGLLQEDGVTDQASKDLGFEVDMNIEFQPKEGIVWLSELALLSPGAAFEGAPTGANAFDAKFAYGLNMKAAISF